MAGCGKELKGTLKQAAGGALGCDRLEADGKAQRLKGKAQRAG